MQIHLILLLTSMVAQYAPPVEVPALGFDGDAFKRDFNASAEHSRLVAVFSPT